MLQALLCLLPVLAVVLPLLARRYPGARALATLRRRGGRSLPRPARGAPGYRSTRPPLARGGLLIGCSLAVRPPPPLASAG